MAEGVPRSPELSCDVSIEGRLARLGTTYVASMSRDRKNFEARQVPQSAMTERKKEDEKTPAKLPPFVELQLLVAVEDASGRLNVLCNGTNQSDSSYRSI